MNREDELTAILVQDLVRLAQKTNKVVTQGNYPGAIADDVNELLSWCQAIYDQFTDHKS